MRASDTIHTQKGTTAAGAHPLVEVLGALLLLLLAAIVLLHSFLWVLGIPVVGAAGPPKEQLLRCYPGALLAVARLFKGWGWVLTLPCCVISRCCCGVVRAGMLCRWEGTPRASRSG